MSRPLALGLIIFFVLIIGFSAFWLTIRPPAPQIAEPERAATRRFFGFFGIGGEGPAPETGATPDGTTKAVKEQLTLLSSDPVADFGVRGTSSVRYIERRTGHIYESGPQGETKIRISNTTIPKIFYALWSPDASHVLFRYTDNESVRAASAALATSSARITPFPSSLFSAAFSPSIPAKILYALPSDTGGRIMTADPDNSQSSETLSTLFPEFLVSWPVKNKLSLSTRPSGTAPGFLYHYDLQKKQSVKILGDIPGLQILWSPSGNRLLYSAEDAETRLPQLSVYDLAAKITGDLGIRTLASKCAFGAGDETVIYCGVDPQPRPALYPDDWLSGALSFSDQLWKINTATLEKTLLNIPSERFIDAIHLRVSPDDRFLYFIDKKDNSLWSYKLNN